MMNFVTSVFKRYLHKNEIKTENEKYEENRAQSENQPARSEGLDEPSFSSSESLSEKHSPSEPNEHFQDAQENPTISNVSSEINRDNRDNLSTSDSKGKFCDQIPGNLCDTSSDEAMLHRYDEENLKAVLPYGELDLLDASLVDSLHESGSSRPKVIDTIDDAINNKKLPTFDPTSPYDDSNSSKNIRFLVKTTDQKSGSTETNKSTENVAIKNQLVSLSDILDYNSVPAPEQPFESNLHVKIINDDATNNHISSECVTKPESALQALIHSVNNTFVVKTSHTNGEKTEDTILATDEKNDAANNELRTVANIIEITTDVNGKDPAITIVDSTADRQVNEKEKIRDDITNENKDKFKKDDISLLANEQIESDNRVINAVPTFKTSDTTTNRSIVKTNINENTNNCKELDAENRYDEQIITNNVSQSSENIPIETEGHETLTHLITNNSVEIGSISCDENVTQIKSDRKSIIHNASCREHVKIVKDSKTEQTDFDKTSTSLQSDKLKAKDLEIKTDHNNEVKVSGDLNLEPTASEMSEISTRENDFNKGRTVLNITDKQNNPPLIMTGAMVLIKEKVNEDTTISTQNTKKSDNSQSIREENGKEQIFDDISRTQDLANIILSTILEESLTSVSSISKIPGEETAEHTNNSKENIRLIKDINQKIDLTILDESSVIDNFSDQEKIEAETADSAFSGQPEKSEREREESIRTLKMEKIEGTSSGTEFSEKQLGMFKSKTNQQRNESNNTNHELLIVSTTQRSINPLDEFQLKSESNIDTANIQSPARDTKKCKTIKKYSNDSITSKEEYKEPTVDKFCPTYERQDTQEFENLERQFEEQNLDVNKLQTADILEKVILESNRFQRSKIDKDNHNHLIHQTDDREQTKVENIQEIQCGDRENVNILHRQDTQEFEHFEKQYKEEECRQLTTDNILEELVAECTGRNNAEDNKAKGSFKQDEGTEIAVESNTKDEDIPSQKTFTDSDVKQILKTGNNDLLDKLPSSKTEIDLACIDSNNIHVDNNDQNRSSDEHVRSENKNQKQKDIVDSTEIWEDINNNLKDKAEIRSNEKNEETNISSQYETQELNIEPVTNEYQNRNEELMSKVDLLQQELNTIRKSNKRKGKQTSELEEKRENNKNVISEYKNLLEEYEKQIVQQDNDLEKMKVKCKENVRRFTTTEMAFSDVFEKYEKAKYAITVYRKNEDILLENIQNAEEQLSQVETKCLSMKQQAAEQINRAHEQVEQEKAKCKQEITKLQVQVKMLEIKAVSLETALQQKFDECQALAALCEDMAGGNTTR